MKLTVTCGVLLVLLRISAVAADQSGTKPTPRKPSGEKIEQLVAKRLANSHRVKAVRNEAGKLRVVFGRKIGIASGI